MKLLIYITICVIVLSACGKKDEPTIPYNITEKSNLNPFFLENKVRSLTYRGRFSSEDEGDNAESIRKWEKNPAESNIICQEEEIKDKMKENEKGFHQYLLSIDEKVRMKR